MHYSGCSTELKQFRALHNESLGSPKAQPFVPSCKHNTMEQDGKFEHKYETYEQQVTTNPSRISANRVKLLESI
eukprot:19609-Pleurochrysis_carterae.AAC.2